MIYVPVDFLKSGMVLARDVPSGNPSLALMIAGQTLTAKAIRNVDDRGIKGLYIEVAGSEDVEYEEFLHPEQKQAMLSDVKSEFDNVEKRGGQINYKAVTKMAESIVLGVLDHDALLCNVLDIRDYDNYTYAHSLSVGIVGVVLGRHFDLPPAKLTEIATAGLLHDIGKLDIPQKVINKPGALTDEEFELVRQHPEKAVARLRALPGCRESVLQGVATHHEHFDGTGYYRGMTGSHIPLYGRILAIADVYDALSSNRSYRQSWSPTQVIDYITSRSGTQFDPDLMGPFLASVSAYPVGTMVKFSDGSVGIVIRNHPELILRPTVRFLSPPERRGWELDLSKDGLHITILDILSNPDEAPGFELTSGI